MKIRVKVLYLNLASDLSCACGVPATTVFFPFLPPHLLGGVTLENSSIFYKKKLALSSLFGHTACIATDTLWENTRHG